MNDPSCKMLSNKEIRQKISDGDKLIGAMEVIVEIIKNHQTPTGDVFIRCKDWDTLVAPYIKQSNSWKLKE